MTKKKEKGARLLTDIFDFPKEATLGLPRIVMVGNEELMIENHNGVANYSSEEIRIITKNGAVCIKGKEVLIKCIDTERVFIQGEIMEVCFEG